MIINANIVYGYSFHEKMITSLLDDYAEETECCIMYKRKVSFKRQKTDDGWEKVESPYTILSDVTRDTELYQDDDFETKTESAKEAFEAEKSILERLNIFFFLTGLTGLLEVKSIPCGDEEIVFIFSTELGGHTTNRGIVTHSKIMDNKMILTTEKLAPLEEFAEEIQTIQQPCWHLVAILD